MIMKMKKEDNTNTKKQRPRKHESKPSEQNMDYTSVDIFAEELHNCRSEMKKKRRRTNVGKWLLLLTDGTARWEGGEEKGYWTERKEETNHNDIRKGMARDINRQGHNQKGKEARMGGQQVPGPGGEPPPGEAPRGCWYCLEIEPITMCCECKLLVCGLHELPSGIPKNPGTPDFRNAGNVSGIPKVRRNRNSNLGIRNSGKSGNSHSKLSPSYSFFTRLVVFSPDYLPFTRPLGFNRLQGL